MNATVKVDTREFKRAMDRYAKTTTKGLPEIVNQRAANVVRRMLEIIPPRPGTEQATRSRIRSELTEILAVPVRRATSGKRKGQYIRAGSITFTTRRGKGKDRALRRVHLIAQAARKKAGKPGLYGESMRAYAGAMVGSRQRGVGWLKAILIPLALGLQSHVKYKIPARYTRNISRWPGSVGSGTVTVARKGWNPFANLLNTLDHPSSRGSAQAERIYSDALNTAVVDETAEMKRHTEKKLADAARRFNR
jgi:hypothetical protein